MLRIRTLGLTLIGVFALSAIAASTASAALPEFKEPFPKKFTSTGGEEAIIYPEGHAQPIICHKATTYEGEITGKKSGSMVMRFKECVWNGLGPCTSAGASSGEVATYPLNMTLGYIKKSTKEVGMALKGTGGEEENFLAEFECNDDGTPISFKIKDGVIGAITPINTATKEFAFNLAENATTRKQRPEKLEGGIKETLEISANRGVYEEALLITKGDILTEKVTEIVA